MPEQVKVEDLLIFRQFRASLLKFAQIAANSLVNAESNIARTRSWLEGEQRSYWESQLRKRMEAVTQAREVVRQKKMYKDSSGRTPSAIEEEKALAKCVAAVEHGRQRLESIKRWLPKLEKAAGLYRSGVSRLSKTVDDLPQAAFLLDRLYQSLEHYVQIESPSGATSESAGAGFEGSVSRGGESNMVPGADPLPGAAATAGDSAGIVAPGAAEALPVGETTDSVVPSPAAPVEKEPPHVTDGQ